MLSPTLLPSFFTIANGCAILRPCTNLCAGVHETERHDASDPAPSMLVPLLVLTQASAKTAFLPQLAIIFPSFVFLAPSGTGPSSLSQHS